LNNSFALFEILGNTVFKKTGKGLKVWF
jgi:hypothetical protein